MAIAHLKISSCLLLNVKSLCLTHLIGQITSNAVRGRFLSHANNAKTCSDTTRNLALTFDSDHVTHFAVTNEIHFYRHCGNQFSQMNFTDCREPYGPPLAVLLPWKSVSEDTLKKFVEYYGEKGFDVLTVSLEKDQIMYPCSTGHAMNVVSDFLQYLNEKQKYRPYIFHGFSIAVYVFGEMMAQLADHYSQYKDITHNVKGCLWDSPVDFLTVNPCLGKFLYPKNWIKRWRCNGNVRQHFKKHHHDSVSYWLRSRDNFCNPIIKVPNVFFLSYTDLLSNPNTVQSVQYVLECNGIPIFQKTFWDSRHTQHFEKYCYEYLYGMNLFFNLAHLCPDESGKYKSSFTTASLTNLRLKKVARESFSD